MKTINIYAGRPGAGKTLWARQEIDHVLSDKNNVVVYIGHKPEMRHIEIIAQGKPGITYLAEEQHAAQAIGRAIDIVNNDSALLGGQKEEDNETILMQRKQVYVFYDQCRYSMYPGRRDLLIAAAKAGVRVNILCQLYSQVDKNDTDWLAENCTCYIISKARPPRLASEEEKSRTYR